MKAVSNKDLSAPPHQAFRLACIFIYVLAFHLKSFPLVETHRSLIFAVYMETQLLPFSLGPV